MSFEEYLTFDQNSPDVKYEYIDGYARAMAGGTLEHSALAVNMIIALREALGRQGPCRVYNSDARVKLKERCVHPDAVVTCDVSDRGKSLFLASPHLVVEVLSPSTELYDRGEKFKYYQEVATIQEYVLVNYRNQLVEVFRREGKEWIYHCFLPGEEIQLESLDIVISMTDLYAGINIPILVPPPEESIPEQEDNPLS